jgi:hypothetical protein
VKILVGRWGLKGDVEANREQLREAGADLVATTLAETRDELSTWLPILSGGQSRAAENGSATAAGGRALTATPIEATNSTETSATGNRRLPSSSSG